MQRSQRMNSRQSATESIIMSCLCRLAVSIRAIRLNKFDKAPPPTASMLFNRCLFLSISPTSRRSSIYLQQHRVVFCLFFIEFMRLSLKYIMFNLELSEQKRDREILCFRELEILKFSSKNMPVVYKRAKEVIFSSNKCCH